MGRRIAAVAAGALASLLIASSAFAFECTNASKHDPADGAQVVLDAFTGEILWATPGAMQRMQRGLIDPETGEGFRGIIAFDLDGDGVADASTWLGVGPDGEIPHIAQLNGPLCRGLTNIGIYLTECVQ